MQDRISRNEYIYGADHAAWSYPPDYLWFSTPITIRTIVARRAHELFPYITSIWDMFAGVGADTVSLATQFPSASVVASEIDPEIFVHLQLNTKKFSPRVTLLQKDCQECQDVTADMVYFDPPWGDTFVSGINFDFNPEIVALLRRVLLKFPRVIIKVPYLCSTFESEFPIAASVETLCFSKQKLKFYFIWGYRAPTI